MLTINTSMAALLRRVVFTLTCIRLCVGGNGRGPLRHQTPPGTQRGPSGAEDEPVVCLHPLSTSPSQPLLPLSTDTTRLFHEKQEHCRGTAPLGVQPSEGHGAHAHEHRSILRLIGRDHTPPARGDRHSAAGLRPTRRLRFLS